MLKKLRLYLKRLYKIISKPVMSILPGQLAFSFVLSIIPLLALLAIIASSLSLSLDTITEFVTNNFPESVGTLLLPLVNGRGFDLSIIIFLITAFWLASGGANSIITSADVIYDIKPQKFIPKRIKAFIMTIILIVLIMFMFIFQAFGGLIFKYILDIPSIQSFYTELTIIYYLLRYPLSFFLILSSIKLIYTIAPNKNVKSKSVTAGALFTTIMWMVLTQIYSFWVLNVVHYDMFYGSISSLIILLLWMYFLAFIFAIGLVMNAERCEEKIGECYEKDK